MISNSLPALRLWNTRFYHLGSDINPCKTETSFYNCLSFPDTHTKTNSLDVADTLFSWVLIGKCMSAHRSLVYYCSKVPLTFTDYTHLAKLVTFLNLSVSTFKMKITIILQDCCNNVKSIL